MADVVSFDPINLLIIEEDTTQEVNTISILEVYGEWKDWLLADASRLGYPQAFLPVGGFPITATRSQGITYFLRNGWRIRPAEYSHKLVVEGNVYTEEENQSIFVPTAGAFNVHTETVVSNLVELFSAAALAGATFDEPLADHQTAGSIGEAIRRARDIAAYFGAVPGSPAVHKSTGVDVSGEGIDINITEGPAGTYTAERQ